ncbi:MAG: TetR/AcrR family transcriptional regulator [Candidatus Sumerlaeaceae bacterium]|nr:TetR/AcrR family transcriptional regulator [Candidatus Sumerlaeaceae bacterium]
MSKDKQKDALIAAAHAVFTKKGANSATLEEIAKEAKVDTKTAKSIFANTSAIISDIISRDVDETSELFTRIINDRGKADIKLTRLVRELLLRYQQSYPLFNLASYGLETSGEDLDALKGALKQEHLDRYRQNTAIIGRLIAQGQSENLFTDVDPLEAAYLLRGMISAAIRFRQIAKKENDMRDHADSIMRVFLKGLLR